MKISIVTTAQRNALTSGTGTLVYNTDTSSYEVYNGAEWLKSGGESRESISISAAGTTTLLSNLLPNRFINVDVLVTTALTYTIILPNQSRFTEFVFIFKFPALSQNVTIELRQPDNTLITSVVGNPIAGVVAYPQITVRGNNNVYTTSFVQYETALSNVLSQYTTTSAFKTALGLGTALSNADVFDTYGNFLYSKLPGFQVEEFMQNSTGTNIPFTAATANSGAANALNPEQQPNWNSTTLRPRLGQVALSTGTSLIGGGRATLATAFNYALYANTEFMIGFEWSLVNGSVNTATDNVLFYAGFISQTGTATPQQGVYFRPPRSAETQFLKYVVLSGGTETVFSTSIAYDTNDRRYISTAIIWDGTNMTFISKDNATTSTNVISNYLTTYTAHVPTSTTFAMSIGVVRQSILSLAPNRVINVDRAYLYIKDNF